MPELPEVESIRRKLLPVIVGKTITNVTVLLSTTLLGSSERIFRNQVIGKTIQGIQRKGKYLFFELSPVGYIQVHLRMTGRLLFTNEIPAYARVKIEFTDGKKLWFADMRTFGKMAYFKTIPEQFLLLVDGLEDEISVDWLFHQFSQRSVALKTALLDQSIVAGIGNIYACEIAFFAGVSPFRKVNTLTKNQVRKIQKGIQQILTQATEAEGTTFSDYMNSDGKPGNFQLQLMVYNRKDEPCKRCKQPIQKITFQQRGTYFCSKCQK